MGGEGNTTLLQQEDIDEEFVRCKYFAVGCIEKVFFILSIKEGKKLYISPLIIYQLFFLRYLFCFVF